MKEPDVSVIVVLFNQARFTLQCMRALIAQKGVSLELILLDNCSTDRTEELLAKLIAANENGDRHLWGSA